MKQRRRLKLVKDYGYVIYCHLDNANVVAGTLSKKIVGQLAILTT